MKLTNIRHAYPEKHIFIDRKKGLSEYTLLHFFHSVKIMYHGEMIETKPHAVIIYDKWTPQLFRNETPIVHDWMHFDGDASELRSLSNLELDTIYYPSHSEFITQLTKEMETEFYGERQDRKRLIELKFEELMIKLGRAVSGEAESVFAPETNEKFSQLRERMFSSLGEKWPVERMAREVGLSKSRFFSIYKAIYGISPTADVIEARVNAAKNMLFYGKKSIQEIAASLGYDNTTHFIRQFKKETGYSPASYRKLNKGTYESYRL